MVEVWVFAAFLSFSFSLPSFLLLLFPRARYQEGAAGVMEFYNGRFGWREPVCRRVFGIYRPWRIPFLTYLGMAEPVYTRLHVCDAISSEPQCVCALLIQGPGQIRATEPTFKTIKSVTPRACCTRSNQQSVRQIVVHPPTQQSKHPPLLANQILSPLTSPPSLPYDGPGILASASRNIFHVSSLEILTRLRGLFGRVSLLSPTCLGIMVTSDSWMCFDMTGLSMLLINSRMKAVSDFGGSVLYRSRKTR